MKYFILHARLICKSYFYIDCEIAAAVRCAGNGEHNGCFQVSFPIPMRLWNWIFPRCRFIPFYHHEVNNQGYCRILISYFNPNNLIKKRDVACLASWAMYLLRLLYDYYQYKHKGKLPRIVHWLPYIWYILCQWNPCAKKTCNPDIFHATFVWNMLKHLEPDASKAKCCAKLVNSVKVHQLCMELR